MSHRRVALNAIVSELALPPGPRPAPPNLREIASAVVPSGNRPNFRQDLDSTVGGNGYWAAPLPTPKPLERGTPSAATRRLCLAVKCSSSEPPRPAPARSREELDFA
jgi:hypothetical protein